MTRRKTKEILNDQKKNKRDIKEILNDKKKINNDLQNTTQKTEDRVK
jgi:predicted phage-related endonuclease